MYTTHSLEELQVTSRTPTLHVPREVTQEFDRHELCRAALEMGQGDAGAAIRRGIRHLIDALVTRLSAVAAHTQSLRFHLSTYQVDYRTAASKASRRN